MIKEITTDEAALLESLRKYLLLKKKKLETEKHLDRIDQEMQDLKDKFYKSFDKIKLC